MTQSGLPLLTLAVKSVRNRGLTAMLTILAIALSVMLFLGVEKIRHGARASFENTISGADLVVGARSGQINLLLYAVFRIGDATNNITWTSYEAIRARPEVAWTIPISLGDSHRGYRVLGTNTDYFTHYKYGSGRSLAFRDGAAFEDVFDVVLGAEAARRLGYAVGDTLTIAHGIGATSFAEHDEFAFTVSGVLRPTGTPVDRTVHVRLEGLEAVHIGWESGARLGGAAAIPAERLLAENLQPDQITAAIVGLHSRIAVLRLQRDINTYRGEALLAVIPGVALAQLWSTIGVAEQTLSAIAAFVVFMGLIGMQTNILTSLNERRREMAILRAVGARPWHVFALLVSEAVMLAGCGALIGMIFVYTGLQIVGPIVEIRYGLALSGLAPGGYDLAIVAALLGAAAAMGAVPAFRAYRNALVDGLTLRL